MRLSGCTLSAHFERSVNLAAPVEAVFECLDDFEKLGEHMTRPQLSKYWETVGPQRLASSHSLFHSLPIRSDSL
jgi:hypothetical protein